MNAPSVKKELVLTNGHLAYQLSDGATPTVIFMGGFKSDMQGAKATTLETFCRARDQRFIRFDYSGHGESSGDFKDGTIGQWHQDALAVLDTLGSDENIIIGSSMGAWMGLLCTMARPQKVKALMGIASAPDFTEALIWEKLSDAQKKELMDHGVYYAPSCYGEDPYPIMKSLIEEGRNHLLLHKPINITCPIRLIHGDKDADVPWQHSVQLMQQLQSADVRLQLVKNGDHRLSTQPHLQLMTAALEELLSNLKA